ncbi:MAG: hypothetical protein A3B69_05930 [Gammaproteobacteria bacterium RIFCSPHIGHO2_02_FULL_38_33]|nr:MAG: hypothetical protein A3B69_05930 [Gammaproteobacteria bacterium RIFCSPHIGHO2_02_FULL_38_33]
MTGGSGFIGRYVVADFVSRGYDVFSTYRRNCPSENKKNNLKFIYTDFYNLDALPKQYDVLVHCGAVNPGASSSDSEMYATNVKGSQHVFFHAMRSGVKLIIYLSSVSVYGTIKKNILKEDHPIEPTGAYGFSKFYGDEPIIAENPESLFNNIVYIQDLTGFIVQFRLFFSS